MKRSSFFVPLLAILTLVMAALFVGCDGQPVGLEPVSGDQPPLNKGVPADGNGNKFVDAFDFTEIVTCGGGEIITQNFAGWAQGRLFGPPNNRNVRLDIFHAVITHTNADGDTFVWRDVGPDHYYVDNDNLFVTISGRSTASGNINRNEIVVGHVVLNLTTREVVFLAGNEYGTLVDLACGELM